MTYLQKYKQHGDTEYPAKYFWFRNVTVDHMLQSQRFYHKDCWSNQGRIQDFNGALQDIAQNFDDDVIIKTLTSLS